MLVWQGRVRKFPYLSPTNVFRALNDRVPPFSLSTPPGRSYHCLVLTEVFVKAGGIFANCPQSWESKAVKTDPHWCQSCSLACKANNDLGSSSPAVWEESIVLNLKFGNVTFFWNVVHRITPRWDSGGGGGGLGLLELKYADVNISKLWFWISCTTFSFF